MESLKTAFLTGFTGALGKRLAYRLAAQGYRVICLVRAGSDTEARQRFDDVVHGLGDLLPNFDESLTQQMIPVPGDVREGGLGLPSSAAQYLAEPENAEVWHLATLQDLTETRPQEVYDTNLTGTLNVLGFIQAHRIPRLHYFSSLFASGRIDDGIVTEIPGIPPPSFRNTWERTLWEAECHVWQAQIRGEVSAAIYRPGILVGDSVQGCYERFNGFNHFLAVVTQARTKLGKPAGSASLPDPLRFDLHIAGDENAMLHLVPVDLAVDMVMRIHDAPRSTGRTYHLVNPHPPTLRGIMEAYQRHQPWEGLRWAHFKSGEPFLNSQEEQVNRALAGLAPYLHGRATYENFNAQAVLAFAGGIPAWDNHALLEVIFRRGTAHGWQKTQENTPSAAPGPSGKAASAALAWPEGSHSAVKFLPHPSVEIPARPAPAYSLTERFLSRAYRLREQWLARRRAKHADPSLPGRDVVLVPFGMGISHRGEGETYCYQPNRTLANEVFESANPVLGFDLEAYARQEVRDHPRFDDIHDNCSWAVVDDFIHLMRLFRDLQQAGTADLVSRLQILPYSAGTYLAGWLAGICSFHDMLLITHQCSHLNSIDERRVTLEEIDRCLFSGAAALNDAERTIVAKIREGLDAAILANRDRLADQLHGKLELVFSLNARILEQLVAEVQARQIGVRAAITMSPNTVVFAGSDLAIRQFRTLFAGRRRVELRRVPLAVAGTTHCARLKAAGKHATALMREFDRQGRLRDPVIPFPFHTGALVRTRGDYIEAVAGIADQTFHFDRMIERVLEGGGRHFLFVQSGMAATAGDLFDGILRAVANDRGFGPIEIHRPSADSPQPHPIGKVLTARPEQRVPDANAQRLDATVRWYEQQLSALRSAAPV